MICKSGRGYQGYHFMSRILKFLHSFRFLMSRWCFQSDVVVLHRLICHKDMQFSERWKIFYNNPQTDFEEFDLKIPNMALFEGAFLTKPYFFSLLFLKINHPVNVLSCNYSFLWYSKHVINIQVKVLSTSSAESM